MKTYLITGATSGFGKVIAQEILKKPTNLIILARSKEKYNTLLNNISKEIHADSKVNFIECDLDSLDSIEQACNTILNDQQKLDNLILNAGIMNFEHKKSKDGIELTFQVNLLANVLICEKLFPIIPNNGESKILITASALHKGTIDFEDIEYEKEFSSLRSYSQSKLGVILMTRLYSQDKRFNGISVYSVHPGIVNTHLGRSAGWFSKLIFKLMGKSLEEGAATHLHLLHTSSSELQSGAYYAKSKLTESSKESYDMNLAGELYNTCKTYLQKYLQ